MPDALDSPLERFALRPPALTGGVELRVQLVDPRSARLLLSHGDTRAELLAAYLSVPYPSGLRRLLSQRPEVDAVIVDRVPSGLIQAAEEAGVGVLDVRGHGRLVAPGLVYVAPPPPSPGGSRRSTTSPFAPKASRVVRGLLVEPEQRWRVSDLAGFVDVDVGNAHRILGSLVEMGLVERDEETYLLPDPGSLLEAWAELQRRPREWLTIASDQLRGDLHELVRALSGQAVVSGELAAELHEPHLRSSVATLHCFSAGAVELLQHSGPALRFPGRADGRIAVDVVDPGAAQFATLIEGLPIAHPVQVYVDLCRSRGRGREAAEHRRREKIPF
jgi:hypothetical protein